MAQCEQFLRRTEEINRDVLSREDRLTLAVFSDQLKTFVDGYKWKDYGNLNPINFLEGLHRHSSWIKAAQYETRGDFTRYLRRLGSLPTQIEEMMELLERAIQLGRTNHLVSMLEVSSVLAEYVISIEEVEHHLHKLDTSKAHDPDSMRSWVLNDFSTLLAGAVAETYDSSLHLRWQLIFRFQRGVLDALDRIADTEPQRTVYYKPFLDDLDRLPGSPEIRKNLRSQGSDVISARVQPSVRRLKNFLSLRYLPATRKHYAISSLDGGTEYYHSLLKWHLSVDMDPEVVYDVGVRQVERIRWQMENVMRYIGFGGNLTAFFRHLQAQKQFHPKTEKEMLENFYTILFERIQPRLPSLFSNLSVLPNISIQRMSFDGVAAQYINGTLLANTRRPATRLSFTFLPLLLHEANPGHHLQTSFARLQNLPNFRRFIFGGRKYAAPFHFPYYTAFVEGWALYAEYLGTELGLYEDAHELFGRLSLEILRACRLVVDVGIHMKQWSRDDAIEYMLNYTVLSRDQTEKEVDRYITWPAQACAYKIGELKITELRTKAQDKLGYPLDVRRFHSSILELGSVPLWLLEKVIDEWIETHVTSSSHVSCPLPVMVFVVVCSLPLLFFDYFDVIVIARTVTQS
ncbi:hypothetical protein LSAT2_020410 [Lamellibrachia satsuma]|nr:hypothetical protein LSAT2_020410 [Lamellibrachia satsuma]